MQLIPHIQVGKNGVTENLIESIKTYFKNKQNIKVVFLKNSVRDKKKLKEATEEIINALGNNYTYRVVGFTMMIKKWRRQMRNSSVTK